MRCARTWADFRKAIEPNGLRLVAPGPDDGPLPGTRRVDLTCRCGRTFTALVGNVHAGNTRSCGCARRRWSWDDVLKAAAKHGVTVQNVPDDRTGAPDAILTVTCRCGATYRPTYVHLVGGRSRSCGCSMKRVTWERVVNAAARAGMTVEGAGTGFVAGTTRVQAVCSCGRRFEVRAQPLADGRVVTCGCRRGRRLSREGVTAAATALGASLEVPDGVVSQDELSGTCRCGGEWHPLASNLMRGAQGLFGGAATCGCERSRPQRELAEWLAGLGEAVEREATPFPGGPRFDVWLPRRRLAVEYDGLLWHAEAFAGERRKSATWRRRQACLANGARLIAVFEDEWLRRPDVVRSRLLAVLGRFDHRVGARSTVVAQGRPDDVRELLERNHLQGSGKGLTLALRSLTDGTVLAAAVFARANASRNAVRAGTWELMRYVVRPGWTVSGGFSRLLAAFWRNVPECQTLTSYSDNRWSEGDVYLRSGFANDGDTGPGYWYFERNATTKGRIHRFQLRKQVLLKRFGGDPAKTEWALAQEAGYDRVWDLGNVRWVLQRPSSPAVACAVPPGSTLTP